VEITGAAVTLGRLMALQWGHRFSSVEISKD